MHPNPRFRADADWLAFADERGFAHIFAQTPAGPMAVHAPVSRFGHELWFHVARANRIAPHLDGTRVVVSVAEVDGYVSPNWYAAPPNQVPTWNFVAAEFEGTARAIDEDTLIRQLDTLAARHEPRVNPADPWTRSKMDEVVFRKMLTGISGFAVTVETIRETKKLSQNKPEADRAAVIAGVRASGNVDLAEAMVRA